MFTCATSRRVLWATLATVAACSPYERHHVVTSSGFQALITVSGEAPFHRLTLTAGLAGAPPPPGYLGEELSIYVSGEIGRATPGVGVVEAMVILGNERPVRERVTDNDRYAFDLGTVLDDCPRLRDCTFTTDLQVTFEGIEGQDPAAVDVTGRAEIAYRFEGTEDEEPWEPEVVLEIESDR